MNAAVDKLFKDRQIKLWVVYVKTFDGQGRQAWTEQTEKLSDFGTNDALLAVATEDRAYTFSADQYRGQRRRSAATSNAKRSNRHCAPTSGRPPPPVPPMGSTPTTRRRRNPRPARTSRRRRSGSRWPPWCCWQLCSGGGPTGAADGGTRPNWKPPSGSTRPMRRRWRRSRWKRSTNCPSRSSSTSTTPCAPAPTNSNWPPRNSGRSAWRRSPRPSRTPKPRWPQAFNVRQTLDDDVPESPLQKRQLLTKVITSAGAADRELEAQQHAFERAAQRADQCARATGLDDPADGGTDGPAGPGSPGAGRAAPAVRRHRAGLGRRATSTRPASG